MSIINFNEQDSGILATISGRLDTPTAIKAQQEMDSLMQHADKEITINCKDLEYISSSGLRLFLALRKEATTKGGKIIIKHINDDIKKVFMMTGFYNLFDIRD